MLGPSNGVVKNLDEAKELNPNHLLVMTRLTFGDFVMVFAADAQMENWAHFDKGGIYERQ